jgi:hypothetical protein
VGQINESKPDSWEYQWKRRWKHSTKINARQWRSRCRKTNLRKEKKQTKWLSYQRKFSVRWCPPKNIICHQFFYIKKCCWCFFRKKLPETTLRFIFVRSHYSWQRYVKPTLRLINKMGGAQLLLSGAWRIAHCVREKSTMFFSHKIRRLETELFN